MKNNNSLPIECVSLHNRAGALFTILLSCNNIATLYFPIELQSPFTHLAVINILSIGMNCAIKANRKSSLHFQSCANTFFIVLFWRCPQTKECAKWRHQMSHKSSINGAASLRPVFGLHFPSFTCPTGWIVFLCSSYFTSNSATQNNNF